ncbi:MAG: aminotransferase class IV, partial [Hymenobacteraceae bacterium]|nr:aminotransferase class IV [Hymenobacteraceae bacterium]MDX5396065.1 aminotransferase class IV [Hymenobacteraceae bacterium]MDX5512128.1 aminotransferase class IV [Hymenobacteraceae bacterium]
MYLICNNTLIEEEELMLTVRNRAFQYNDGFFESMIVKNGQIRFWEDHLERMMQATAQLKLQIPEEFTEDELNKQLVGLAKVNSIADSARVKVRVWRSGAGLYTPETSDTEYIITIEPFEEEKIDPVVVRTGFYSGIKNHYSPVSFFKG